MTMTLPLEDNFNDVIGKAIRGLKLTPNEVATRAGALPEQVQALSEGVFDESVARKVAPVLNLGPESLVAVGQNRYRPTPISIDGLAQFTTPFDDITVNSYLVWEPATGTAAAFDTGADCAPMIEFAARRELTIKLILLTHTHGDHIFDLDRLKAKTGASAFVPEREPIDGAQPFAAGRTFQIGNLRVETRLTWGHSKGGITYLVSGLSRPVAVVGDSIFAGSMGGGIVSYADALSTNREQILTLPEETVICPGHGPLTAVGEEKRNNPFFAG